MEKINNKYYIRINEKNRVIKGFSDAFETAKEGDIQIGEGFGTQFRIASEKLSADLQHFSDIENSLTMLAEKGIYIYKYENNLIQKISEEDYQEELSNLPKLQPTEVEVLKEENLNLMATTAQLYEKTLELEQQNLDLMLAITEIYEMSI